MVLDENKWQAWLRKGRAQEARSTRTRLETVKMASIVVLLTAAGLWSYVKPYEVGLRFGLALAAIFIMSHALNARRYALAALFGALALLYNPMVPVVPVSADWQRFLLATSTIPFIASLGGRRVRDTP